MEYKKYSGGEDVEVSVLLNYPAATSNYWCLTSGYEDTNWRGPRTGEFRVTGAQGISNNYTFSNYGKLELLRYLNDNNKLGEQPTAVNSQWVSPLLCPHRLYSSPSLLSINGNSFLSGHFHILPRSKNAWAYSFQSLIRLLSVVLY